MEWGSGAVVVPSWAWYEERERPFTCWCQNARTKNVSSMNQAIWLSSELPTVLTFSTSQKKMCPDFKSLTSSHGTPHPIQALLGEVSEEMNWFLKLFFKNKCDRAKPLQKSHLCFFWLVFKSCKNVGEMESGWIIMNYRKSKWRIWGGDINMFLLH